MASLTGKKARVLVCTTSGGTYHAVAGIDKITPTLNGDTVDDSEFGIDWKQMLQALKNFSISLSGKLRTTDTNGQAIILSSFLGDTDLFVKYLPDNGTTSGIGFQSQVIVTKYEPQAGVADNQTLSIELQGTGAVTQV